MHSGKLFDWPKLWLTFFVTVLILGVFGSFVGGYVNGTTGTIITIGLAGSVISLLWIGSRK